MTDAYDPALVAYVWRNYKHLLTRAEWQAANALVGQGKIEGYVTRGHRAPEDYADVVREMFGSLEVPETKALLADGIDVFYRRAAERILREHSASLVINRCPSCGSIVVSPRSRQCLSCHYDWHPRPSSSQ